MGMKLKSGADLCGFQLTNFCVQGEASAPSDAALGRKYFHTNATDDVATGISLLNRERIYLGEGAWRATAYLDDIAAINEKLNLITGDTDTDTLINNLKDLEEFLKDFSETDKLKSLLDGKLNKSGGTINSTSEQPLILNSNKSQVRLLIQRSEENMSTFGWHTSFGTWMYDHASGYSLGINIKDGTPFYNDGTFHTLIHSGNIGSYAVKTKDGIIVNDEYNIMGYGSTSGGWPKTGPAMVWGSWTGYRAFLHGRNGVLSFNTMENGTLTGWKTIAFTDSIVAAAKALVDKKDVTLFKTYDTPNNHWSLGLVSHDAYIDAKNTYFRYSGTHSTAMLINSSGNVLISTTTDSGEKLQVAGKASFTDRLYAPYIFMGKDDNGIYIHKAGISWHDSKNAYVTEIAYFASDAVEFRKPITISGDLYVKGNIIATKEISAGGAGAEEGTSGSGSAEGVSEIFTPTSTSMAFDHNLGEDVIVQVYEKNNSVWNLVMVDVEITSATRVTLRFGKTETTQHKVVIMGV